MVCWKCWQVSLQIFIFVIKIKLMFQIFYEKINNLLLRINEISWKFIRTKSKGIKKVVNFSHYVTYKLVNSTQLNLTLKLKFFVFETQIYTACKQIWKIHPNYDMHKFEFPFMFSRILEFIYKYFKEYTSQYTFQIYIVL